MIIIIMRGENFVAHRLRITALEQRSATFSLPRAALAIHIFVEGRGKILISWTVRETVFNLSSIGLTGIHLKMDNNCTYPYNQVHCKDVVC
jgi:hypothetical protein